MEQRGKIIAFIVGLIFVIGIGAFVAIKLGIFKSITSPRTASIVKKTITPTITPTPKKDIVVIKNTVTSPYVNGSSKTNVLSQQNSEIYQTKGGITDEISEDEIEIIPETGIALLFLPYLTGIAATGLYIKRKS